MIFKFYRVEKNAAARWALQLSFLFAEEGVKPVAAHAGQEVPGVAAVSHFGLRFVFHWSLRNMCSCLKRRRCPTDFLDHKVTGGNYF